MGFLGLGFRLLGSLFRGRMILAARTIVAVESAKVAMTDSRWVRTNK